MVTKVTGAFGDSWLLTQTFNPSPHYNSVKSGGGASPLTTTMHEKQPALLGTTLCKRPL